MPLQPLGKPHTIFSPCSSRKCFLFSSPQANSLLIFARVLKPVLLFSSVGPISSLVALLCPFLFSYLVLLVHMGKIQPCRRVGSPCTLASRVAMWIALSHGGRRERWTSGLSQEPEGGVTGAQHRACLSHKVSPRRNQCLPGCEE